MLIASIPPVASITADAVAPRRTTRPRTLTGLAPGWPVTALLVGYPVWWALGLGSFVFQILAVPMAWYLLRRKRLLVPRGFGIWLLFLLWVVASMLMLGVNPTGTLPEPWTDRLLVASLRLSQYLSLTVLLLYIGNLPRAYMDARRLTRLLGIAFVWTSLGGLLGVLAPHFGFVSPVEALVPEGLRENIWIKSMVHPSAAQIQNLLGEGTARPAAPFGFTNAWGHNYALLVVWFIVAYLLGSKGWRRWLALLLLSASVVPVVTSLNRGLWLGLAIAIAYVAVRTAAHGHIWPLIATSISFSVLIAALLFSPLSALMSERMDNPESNRIRTFTTEKALEVSTRSPILGFGSTRDALGSAQSIAIGTTPTCPRCGNTPLGQNGHVWLLLISHGVVAVVLYAAFFAAGLKRSRRALDPISTGGTLTLLLGLFFMLFYDALMTPAAFLMLSYAALWRHEVDSLGGEARGSDGSLRRLQQAGA